MHSQSHMEQFEHCLSRNDLSIKTLTYQQNEDASIETLNELGNGMKENTSFRVMNICNNNFCAHTSFCSSRLTAILAN